MTGPLRVFFQNSKGWIYEYICDQGWKGGKLTIEAPHQTPLAAVSWKSPRGYQMRLDYRSFSNDVAEVMFADGEWKAGIGRIAPCMINSQLAVTMVPNGASKSSRIYSQQDMRQLQEHSWLAAGGWAVGNVIPTGTTQ